MIRRPPRSTLFHYTTLLRSVIATSAASCFFFGYSMRSTLLVFLIAALIDSGRVFPPTRSEGAHLEQRDWCFPVRAGYQGQSSSRQQTRGCASEIGHPGVGKNPDSLFSLCSSSSVKAQS